MSVPLPMPAAPGDASATIRAMLPPPEGAALLLDFDGTLVEIAERPDAVVVPSDVSELLARAMARLSGRVALVSGRTMAELDAFLPGFDGDAIGSHGAEMRMDGARRADLEIDQDVLAALVSEVHDHAARHPALHVEEKRTGVVLHYRQAPAREEACRAFIEDAVSRAPGFKLQPAKMALEVKPEGAGKDTALEVLLDRDGWRDAVPVYAGDDFTDEPALDLAQRRGGVAVKIGDAASVARHRLPDPTALRALLGGWLG